MCPIASCRLVAFIQDSEEKPISLPIFARGEQGRRGPPTIFVYCEQPKPNLVGVSRQRILIDLFDQGQLPRDLMCSARSRLTFSESPMLLQCMPSIKCSITVGATRPCGYVRYPPQSVCVSLSRVSCALNTWRDGATSVGCAFGPSSEVGQTPAS